jgi:hypothetical protein
MGYKRQVRKGERSGVAPSSPGLFSPKMASA